jgi:hypothetical protein
MKQTLVVHPGTGTIIDVVSYREFKPGFSESGYHIVASHAEHNASVPPFNSSGDPLAYHKLCAIEHHNCSLVADWQVRWDRGEVKLADLCSSCLDDILG